MEDKNRLEKRFSILNNLEYYISESVYYRTHKEEIDFSDPKILWNYDDENGIIDIYEDF